jgi:hypothetical protein
MRQRLKTFTEIIILRDQDKTEEVVQAELVKMDKIETEIKIETGILKMNMTTKITMTIMTISMSLIVMMSSILKIKIQFLKTEVGKILMMTTGVTGITGTKITKTKIIGTKIIGTKIIGTTIIGIKMTGIKMTGMMKNLTTPSQTLRISRRMILTLITSKTFLMMITILKSLLMMNKKIGKKIGTEKPILEDQVKIISLNPESKNF